jgi:hypothetical protein
MFVKYFFLNHKNNVLLLFFNYLLKINTKRLSEIILL